MSTKKILNKIILHVESGERIAVCAIVATRGSTPQPPGVFICVNEAAQMTGTLGGGCVEADVRRQAHQMLQFESSKLIIFELDHDFGYIDGMICGGQLDIAVQVLSLIADIEPYKHALENIGSGKKAVIPIRIKQNEQPVEYRITVEAEPKLLIIGAGHISRVLANMMLPLGFSVFVIDDRSDYANEERFPPPIHTISGDIIPILSDQHIDTNTYIVIVTRGHKLDETALKAVIESPAKYIGMIGSRRKIHVIFDDLKQGGISEELLSRVNAPIGVDIGAVTTEEIALSIAAQLVEVRREERQHIVTGPILISENVT